MEEDSKIQGLIRWGLGALGLGAVAAAVVIPKVGIWVALAIVLLALLLFGGYFLWQRLHARRQREQFTSAIEMQTAAAPKAISDPNKRAALDQVRQKFQTGLREFKSRGKDIYKLPWYVIIGESGSGKTEAIRHSGIDFPPGLQDELQGSGGTVNMDWWFTNRGIILDTAGSMIFNEARSGEMPEWREFLRLLKKARPLCPVNGLFLVLSIESLIRDSADRIAQKASILAQQLDLIQRTLDVRFPVYLIVTKCDLLTGFREFFDNIEDPLLQHQMFGWSNPDPLDTPFRPELVDQHLATIVNRVRRRRLALLRETSAAGQVFDTQRFYRSGPGAAATRRLDEVDSMFALPESTMRMAPRLRRYLETIFVAGEWSAKPIFLRGIYFTSSMREGKALDEAIAFATGLSLDQLPEERSWEKNRAFFLRDLFHEKVFRESGLVTRATNTMKLLRQRQVAIFGTAAVALLLLGVFAGFAYRNLKSSVLKEAAFWKAGATGWNQGVWSPGAIVRPDTEPFRYAYAGTNRVEGTGTPNLLEYHQHLRKLVESGLAVGWVFKPVSWMSKVQDRPQAQEALFQGSVLRPLIFETRKKMQEQALSIENSASVERHQSALLSLMQLEADKLTARSRHGLLATTNAPRRAQDYLESFLSYLTESNFQVDTNLTEFFAWTYSAQGGGKGKWPPASLPGGEHLSDNPAIMKGLENFRRANQAAESRIINEIQRLNEFVTALVKYQQCEIQWLSSSNWWSSLNSDLQPAMEAVNQAAKAWQGASTASGALTNIESRYHLLAGEAANASKGAFSNLWAGLPDATQTEGIFGEIAAQVNQYASAAQKNVTESFESRRRDVSDLDRKSMIPVGNAPAYTQRWLTYTQICALAVSPDKADPSFVGDGWKRLGDLKRTAESSGYNLLVPGADGRLREEFINVYVRLVTDKLSALARQSPWTPAAVTNAHEWLGRITADVENSDALTPAEKEKLAPVTASLKDSKRKVLEAMDNGLRLTLGFPVILNAPADMSLPDVKKVSELMNTLTHELQSPIWQTDRPAVLGSLLTNCNRYASLANSLLTPEQNPAEWELFFAPLNSVGDDDRQIIKVFRQVSLGPDNSAWQELTRTISQPLYLGKGTLNEGIRLSFRKMERDNNPETKVDLAAWGVPHLICDPDKRAERIDNGLKWRIRVKLRDASQNLEGDAVFEVVLKKPLPKVEDWPKK